MIGQTVSHYSAFGNPASWQNSRKRDKILEYLTPSPPQPTILPAELSMIGSTVSHHRILVGADGMGPVYKAQDIRLDPSKNSLQPTRMKGHPNERHLQPEDE